MYSGLRICSEFNLRWTRDSIVTAAQWTTRQKVSGCRSRCGKKTHSRRRSHATCAPGGALETLRRNVGLSSYRGENWWLWGAHNPGEAIRRQRDNRVAKSAAWVLQLACNCEKEGWLAILIPLHPIFGLKKVCCQPRGVKWFGVFK